MAGKLFHLDIVTPEAIIWSGPAQMVSARTTEGDIGILADHEATMAALATGPVEIKDADAYFDSSGCGEWFELEELEEVVLPVPEDLERHVLFLDDDGIVDAEIVEPEDPDILFIE